MRDDRCGRKPVVFLDVGLDSVAEENFEGRVERGPRERVSIDSQIERSPDAGRLAILTNRLGHCQNMHAIKTAVERGTPMSGGAEGYLLDGISGVDPIFVVSP